MVLIVGGAYQGQEEAAGTLFPGYKLVAQVQDRILEKVKAGEDPLEAVMPYLKEENTVLTAQEIGCGIVPLDPVEREWREKTGRVLCAAAKEASQVYRMVCGLPVRIK